MIAVIYQGYIKPGREEEYQQLWHHVASYFKKHCGAIGSTLHQTDEGMWVAYSRWPDEKTRHQSWINDDNPNIPLEMKAIITQLKDCIDLHRERSELCLKVIDDLLIT